MTTLRNHYETSVTWLDRAPDDAQISGPVTCLRCGDPLADKQVQLSTSGRTQYPGGGGDLSGYVLQSHHSDDVGGAVCTECADDMDAENAEEEGSAWLAIARWQARDPDRRRVTFGRDGLQLDDGCGMAPRFIAGLGGRIDPMDAHSFITNDERTKA